MAGLSTLSRLQRITLILFVIMVANWVMVSTTGYSLLGGDLFTLFFIVFFVLLGVTLIPPVVRRVVWRVRYRLLVSYFFVGVLPIVLIVIFVCFGFYLVLMQTANYLLHVEIEKRLDQVLNSAERLAQDLSAGRGRTAAGFPDEQTIVRLGNRLSAEFPAWIKPGFKGIVVKADGSHYFAADATAGVGERRAEVFAYQKLDNRTLAELLPALASVLIISGDSLNFKVGQYSNPEARLVLDSENVIPVPGPRGFWDLPLESPVPQNAHSMDDGHTVTEVFVLRSRPSAVLSKLFSTLGSLAVVIGLFLLVIGIAFLCVVLIGILFSAQLTRTLTRAVHDLYTGTKKIEAGDFSHRIPVRTKDQLSELATSFNSMTEHIERLIIEVKEKEKLESELEIARQVQAQLFPKEVPKLATLELAGVCNPARVVSGDYYDFIPLDPRSIALVIGDIAGKGISAALLMASVQSSLHAQLAMGANGGLSTASLVAQLNRQLYENTAPEKYATFYCGIYDEQNGRLAYTNAGHLAPILIRRGKITRLESNGTVVGMFPDCPYEQNEVDLQSGDLLAAFTDGITESENAQGVQFGDERLVELLTRNSDRPLDEIVKVVTYAVRDWAHDLDNQDDTTMLLARRL